MQAVRFHYRPLRYLLTRAVARKSPAFALSRAGCVSLDDVEPPALPGPDWVRVQSTLSGICGSDLSAVTAHDSFTLEPFGAYPFTFGHETVGIVSEVGANVAEWKQGARVTVNPMLACKQRGFDPECDACARGDIGLCRRVKDGAIAGPMIGFSPTVGGGWSESFVAHKSQLFDVTGLSDQVAVLTEPFASALRPVLLHAPKEDDVVLVLGAGSIGLLTIKALRLSGFNGEITVSCKYAFQAERAEQAGASRVLRGREALYKWAAGLRDARKYKPTIGPAFIEGGPSLVYNAVGSTGAMRDALALARDSGRIVLIGAPGKMNVDFTRVWFRQLSVHGVYAFGTIPFEGVANQRVFDAALSLMRRSSFAQLELLTHTFALTEYRQALDTALDKNARGAVKVVFRPDVV
jgi:L-iditol 2-dehydrogenase